MRRLLIAGVASIAVSAAMLAGSYPASGATTPPQVGLVSFVKANLSDDAKTAGLKLRWNKVSHATKYQVFMARSYDGVLSAPIKATTTKDRIWIRGLKPGKDYFFMVRGVNGSTAGSRSSRVGHTTIRAQSSGGPTYRVLTYNVCSAVSECHERWDWSTRQPRAQERIATIQPDVLATQESGGFDTPPGFTLACEKSAKKLFFRSDRFTVATSDDTSASNCTSSEVEADEARIGWIKMREAGGTDRYATWTELVDNATGQHVIFTSIHTTSGGGNTEAAHRQTEIRELLDQLDALNHDNLPVIYAGDFNSHKNRSNDWLADDLHAAGIYDAFDLAQKLKRQHYNSYNDYKTRPVTSVTWGDHVDHVWVDPTRSRVLTWGQMGEFDGTNYAKPIPSDHHPILAVVRVALD